MKRLLPLALIAVFAGCSSIPPGGDPSGDERILALAASARPAHGRLAIAPLVVAELTDSERAKGWKLTDLGEFSARGAQRSLTQATRASRRWAEVRAAETDALSDAWDVDDELLATVEVRALRTQFDGHNGWWIPNMVNFIMNVFPAWFVATEEYSLSFELTVRLQSVASGAVLGEAELPVRVEGTFDEFDRGFQLLGPLWPSFDAETWQTIAAKLFPAAQRQAAVQVAESLDRLADEADRQRSRQTLGLVVGLSNYGRPTELPPLPYAASDARKVTELLGAVGCRPEQVRQLIDEAATREGVLRAIRGHLGRARAGDTVILYAAGYGTRDDAGRPAILLFDATPKAQASWLTLEDLAGLLGATQGRALLIIDAGFGSGGRTLERNAPPACYPSALGERGLNTLLAAGSDEGALAPTFLESGLLTYHLLRDLAGVARDAEVALSSLYERIRADVRSNAELLGTLQVPRRLGTRALCLPGAGPRGLTE